MRSPAAEAMRAAQDCLEGAYDLAGLPGRLRGSLRWQERKEGELGATHALATGALLGLPAARLAEELEKRMKLPPLFSAVAAVDGFLNFRLSDAWYDEALNRLCAKAPGDAPDLSSARFPALDPALAPRQDAASPLYRLRWAYERSRALLADESAPDGEHRWGEAERALLRRIILSEGESGLFDLADAFSRFYAVRPIRSAADKGFRLKLCAAFCRRCEESGADTMAQCHP